MCKGQEDQCRTFREKDLAQRGGYELHQSQRKQLARQRPTDAKESLIRISAVSGAVGDGGDREYLTISYVLKHTVLLIVPDKLDDDDVAGARHGVPLTAKRQQPVALVVRSKKERGFPADESSLSTCEIKTMYSFVTGLSSFLDHSCTRTSPAKFAW